MTERDVTVRLRMTARDWVRGSAEGERALDRLTASERRLGAQSRQTGDELDRMSVRAERAGRRTGRGMLYAAAGVAALGAAGGGIKLLPGLLSAAGVAAGALPPMLLGAAGAGGVLVTSLKGVGKAMGEVIKSDDPFAGLSPSARALVAEVKALQPAVSEFRQGLQDRTLANAAADLNLLATGVLPQVRGGLNELASDWGHAFDMITASIADPAFIDGFNSATKGADWFFDLVNSRIPQTVQSIGALVQSADPLARKFGQGLIDLLDKFNAAVERSTASGSLDDFFRRGAAGAGAFLDISKGVLDITGLVVREVQAQGGTLTDTAAKLDAYLNSGRAAGDVAGVVRTLTVAYEGTRDVLGDLAGLARDALADPGTTQAMQTMFDVLRAGTGALRIVLDLFQVLPDGMQSTVLAAAALALVGSKVARGFSMMEVAAGKAGARIDAVGVGAGRAGSRLQGVVAGAGKAATALLALQVAGVALSQSFGADIPQQSERLADSLTDFARTGKATGEAAKLLGDDLGLLKYDLNQFDTGVPTDILTGWFEWTENLTGLGKVFDETVTNAKDRMASLDATLASMVAGGNAKQAAEVFDRIRQIAEKQGISVNELNKALPSYTNAVYEAATKGSLAGQAAAEASERTRVLAGSFQEAALQGKDLAATFDLLNGKQLTSYEGQIKLQEAIDSSAESIKKNGAEVVSGTHQIDLNTEAGRQNMQGLIGIARAAQEAADARAEETGKVQAGIPILVAAREEFIRQATAATGSAAAARALADQIFKIPDKDIRFHAETQAAIAEIEALGFKVVSLPDGSFAIKANTASAKRNLAEAKAKLDALNGRTATMYVVTRQNFIGPVAPGTPYAKKKADGGVSVPYGRPIAAAMGLVRPEIYPPSSPPLYQFAEPQTGGEMFLPRHGIDRQRGRTLLAIAASWYDGMFVPMHRGGMSAAGVRAAAGGLVTVGARSDSGSAGGTHVDYIEAYIRSRDAVEALSKALKENGRSFSLATAKGRENRTALYASVQAAEDAARARYAETGSVRAANAVYDEHIARLKRMLAQQKVNASTVKKLLAEVARPSFGQPANSLANIGFAKADIAVRGGVTELADALSLNRPGVDVATEHGRANLLEIIQFLEQASAAAQARFEQTKSVKTATSYYESLIGQLRDVLRKAGYSAAVINSLISTYGRITLQPNARGGVYPAAAGGLGVLGAAQIYTRPMYGWAEKSTGGELFLPRLGERARGERLLATAAGWYGGRYTPAGAGSGSTTTINNNLTVNGRMEPMTVGQLSGFMRQMDAEARTGRRK